jgi:CRISPR-associated endonuclease/helicase Cas3
MPHRSWTAGRRRILNPDGEPNCAASCNWSELRGQDPAALAGFISVADWIASDERWFPHAATMATPGVEISPEVYLETARQQARRALAELAWLSWEAPAAASDFASLFPHIREPRPLQEVAIAEADTLTGDPVLFVIEAPTGEGKTEAALHLAQALAARTGRKGFYLALPTQATSNQMFGRAVAFLRKGAAGDHAEVQLLHGHALLSAEFELLRRGDASCVTPAGVALLRAHVGPLRRWAPSTRSALALSRARKSLEIRPTMINWTEGLHELGQARPLSSGRRTASAAR